MGWAQAGHLDHGTFVILEKSSIGVLSTKAAVEELYPLPVLLPIAISLRVSALLLLSVRLYGQNHQSYLGCRKRHTIISWLYCAMVGLWSDCPGGLYGCCLKGGGVA